MRGYRWFTHQEKISVSWQTSLLSWTKSSLLCLSELHKTYFVLILSLFFFTPANKYILSRASCLPPRVYVMSPITGGSGEHRPGGGRLSQAEMPLPASPVLWASLGRGPLEGAAAQKAAVHIVRAPAICPHVHHSGPGPLQGREGHQVSNWDSLQPGQ